ncbi:MAG: hypothetical protein JEZ02_02405 [Desulfatibacillum sp.]|nr:hypothetical protein [Desulfatibacillum sp.]
MIKPNWDIFRAKFNDNPQKNFEWFCYLLFCKRFDRPFGIFRYVNQSGIETEPIDYQGEIVGWQAKFYDTALSNNVTDIKDSIKKSKKYYPSLTKLHFYTNKEWGQYKGEKPQGLKDIESLAGKLDIKLRWKCASFFESSFVVSDNAIITSYFFSMDEHILNTIKNRQSLTLNFLSQIKTEISFSGKTIVIDRRDALSAFTTNGGNTYLLSGVGGVGKTAITKILYERDHIHTPFYVWKATEFEVQDVNQLFGKCQISEFLSAHSSGQIKTIVIDSAEKLVNLRNQESFKDFITVS